MYISDFLTVNDPFWTQFLRSQIRKGQVIPSISRKYHSSNLKMTLLDPLNDTLIFLAHANCASLDRKSLSEILPDFSSQDLSLKYSESQENRNSEFVIRTIIFPVISICQATS